MDETSEIVNQIKEIAQKVDSSNPCEVNTSMCDIIDLCNKIV